ncbi:MULTISPECIES: FadR/GntR family transcriptional regulator [Rhodobacterales]|jgi:DNA-binding FadR family transcriptional regulator|uniref:FCD domain-containing protein n=2 Tax=Paracoccaceae TaxID=31989 RepID=A0A844W6T0_9RHOB|nr:MULTISPECIES: FCD domain-containing protein [Rhodobacterales]MWB78464.1 FCD domain-containing protein [Pseudooceanicola pacificus]PTX39065.1 GntR family transcriptional regulator [Allosediminivita pacifica]GGB28364.1 GntR family transcriptional regulator [Allosediminivita pacifica]
MRTGKDAARARLWQVLEERAPASGDRLPPERVLKDLVGCSRETLRGALATLEARGEIWRHVGQGTFRGRAPLGRPVKDTLLLEATTPADLMDARRLLEPQVATAAALRRVTEDISLLRQRVANGRAARNRAECERADDAFHQSIAQVARNPLLIALLRHFSSARCRAVWQREWDRTYRRVGVEEFTRVHGDHHEQVVDAIAAGDGPAAHRAMAHHLEAVSIDMGVLNPVPSC